MKIKYLLFGIILNLLFINVYAATISFEKSSLIIKEKETEENVLIKLKKDEEEVIKKVEFSLEYNINLISLTPVNQETYLQQTASNATTVRIDSPDAEKSLEDTIFTFNIKNEVSEDQTAEIKIKNLKINGEEILEEETKKINPLNVTLKKVITTTTRAKNTSAKLTNFTVNNATIKPAFSDKIKEYKIYVTKDTIKQITIRPSYEQSGVTLEVECTLGCTSDAATPNKLNLIMGKNEATFTFTSEDEKNTEEYKFIIYRGPTTDGSNLLSSLSLEGIKLNEEFNKSNLDYTATVPYETENLTVNAVSEDANADVKIKGGDNLAVGENVITITVTSAETEEKKIYNITVIREEFVPKEEPTTGVVPVIEENKNSSNSNLKIIIIIGIISFLLIGIAAYFIFFHKKKKTKNSKNNQSKTEKNNILETIDENKEPTTVDDALKDLMLTKEMQIENKAPISKD